MHSDFDIILLLSGSAILLTYMLTFVKPEPDEDDKHERDDSKKSLLKIDPYIPFRFQKYIPSPLLSPSHIRSHFEHFQV